MKFKALAPPLAGFFAFRELLIEAGGDKAHCSFNVRSLFLCC